MYIRYKHGEVDDDTSAGRTYNDNDNGTVSDNGFWNDGMACAGQGPRKDVKESFKKD